MSSTIGKLFTVTTFGESHGQAVGAIIDGVTPGLELNEADIQKELNRRRPGQSDITTPRSEADKVQIMSGIFEGKATGHPIMVMIMNTNTRPYDYSEIKKLYRPGHADYTFNKKYGIRDYRGSGRASGRETSARVAAGAIAKKMLSHYGIKVQGWVKRLGGIECKTFDESIIEKNPVRACDPEAAILMADKIRQAVKDKNSVGGIIECRLSGMIPGLGEPVFDKIEADLAKAVLSVGATKGIEFGAGFAAPDMTGKEHNDEMNADGFLSNNAGGTLGGISTGQDIIFRVAVKPTSSIAQLQHTVDIDGNEVECITEGRHDPCICPRIIPVIESMAAITLIDHLKRQVALTMNLPDQD
jgi:chorismate synthase